MPRRCAVCDHPRRVDLERAVTTRTESYQRIATDYVVSIGSLRRHAATHMVETMAAAHEAQAVGIIAVGTSLLDQVHRLQTQASAILGRAEAAGDLRTALAAIRELRGCLELLGRLEGQISDRATVNVLVAPDWTRLRGVIIDALAAFPDARVAVAQALMAAGHG